jgi:hypothetical protein
VNQKQIYAAIQALLVHIGFRPRVDTPGVWTNVDQECYEAFVQQKVSSVAYERGFTPHSEAAIPSEITGHKDWQAIKSWAINDRAFGEEEVKVEIKAQAPSETEASEDSPKEVKVVVPRVSGNVVDVGLTSTVEVKANVSAEVPNDTTKAAMEEGRTLEGKDQSAAELIEELEIEDDVDSSEEPSESSEESDKE